MHHRPPLNSRNTPTWRPSTFESGGSSSGERPRVSAFNADSDKDLSDSTDCLYVIDDEGASSRTRTPILTGQDTMTRVTRPLLIWRQPCSTAQPRRRSKISIPDFWWSSSFWTHCGGGNEALAAARSCSNVHTHQLCVFSVFRERIKDGTGLLWCLKRKKC